MAKSFRSVVLLFLAVLLAAPLAAQSTGVSVRFNVFALTPASGVGYHPQPQEPLVPVEFYGSTRSAEYSYKGDTPVQFFDTSPGASKIPIAVWDVPPGMRNAFVMFTPRKEPAPDGTRYAVTAVDDSLEKLPPRHFAILNVSGREYEGRCGSNKFTVATGYNPPMAGAGTNYLELAMEINGKHVVVGGCKFELSGTERTTIVIFAPMRKTGLQPAIRSLKDTPIVQEKPGKAAK